MEARSLVSHQHSWWFSCFSLREKLTGRHNNKVTAYQRLPSMAYLNYSTVTALAKLRGLSTSRPRCKEA